MVRFVLRKFILQTCMGSYLVGLDVWFFVYFHTSCVRSAKALARLRGCAGSPEPSLVACVISTIISWAGSFYVVRYDIETVHQPEDHWSCIAHLSAENMLKSAVIEEKKFKDSPWAGADDPLGPHHYGHSPWTGANNPLGPHHYGH